MNNSNIKEDIVIVTTYDNNEYHIKTNILEWNNIVDKAQAMWKKKIFLKDYNENLYFSNIKSEKWKTLFKSLPAPKEKQNLISMSSTEKEKLKQNNPDLYYKMEKEEELARKKTREIVTKALQNSLERRKKNFVEERDKILKQLEVREKNFWLKTTIEKIKDAEKYRILQIKEKL